MADDRFFRNSGPLTLEALAGLTGAVATNPGGAPADMRRSFADIAPIDTATAENVSFLDNVKYLDAFEKSRAGACFVRAKFAGRAPKGMVLLVTEQPYYCFALTARKFYPEEKANYVSPHAHISKTATIGENCSIGPGVFIDDGVIIGDDCCIGAGSTISHAIIGSRAVIHRGVHIGQDGFGFAPGAGGIAKVPQLGRVLIGDDVEIGSGTCIDRGAGPDTTIGHGSKIDNLVQIGHNVRIGKFVMIAAQCGIAGSTAIEDGVMMGGQVGIAGHVTVGKGAKLAAQAGVMADVPAGATYGGFPAVPTREWHRQTVTMARIAKKRMEEQSDD